MALHKKKNINIAVKIKLQSLAKLLFSVNIHEILVQNCKHKTVKISLVQKYDY